ncbi:MAG: tellurite resistance TerB family protein [Sulfitobacter sp.]
MSLMKALAKVAIGVAVAKGASAMMKGGQSDGTAQAGGLGGLLGGLTGGDSSGGGLGGMLGGLTGGSAGGGGLQDMLGGMLGGGSTEGGVSTRGLGGMLESLGGTQGAGGGLGGLLGGMAGAAGAGGLLGGLAGKMQSAPAENDQSFGAVLNSQFDQTPEPAIEPSQDQEAAAGLMLAAMIQAAKSDGTFDDAEKEKLLSHLGDVDAEEAAFVQTQMQAPIDIDGLVANTPAGLGQQVYAMSVMAIDLDTGDEAQYLHKLATAYGMEPAQVNAIHEQMGVPSLYT